MEAVEATLGHRLDQIVQRAGLKGPHRKRFVRGHEHHRRHPRHPAFAQDIEAVEPRHLHVEEHQIRLERVKRPQRLPPVPRLAHDHDVRVSAEQLPDAAAGQRFIVHDQGADVSHRRHRLPSSAVW